MKNAPVAPPATYSITREGLTVWHGGKAVLVIPREALPGVSLRCLVAWHEGGYEYDLTKKNRPDETVC